MRLCRYDDNRIGLVDGDMIADVTTIAAKLPRPSWPLPLGDLLIEHLPLLRPEIEAMAAKAPRRPVAGARLLSPVANPSKIIAVGQSYMGHIEEAKKDTALHSGGTKRIGMDTNSIRFLIKANSALVGPSDGVALRFLDQRNDPELEFAIVIGKRCTDIPKARALEVVAGYALGFDMTLRGPEPPSGRKSLDSYAVLGPWLTTADEIADPNAVPFVLSVNGETRQNANTRDLIYSIQHILWEAGRRYTLYPGDIIMTGTPEGVAQVYPGDTLRAEAPAMGSYEVAIRAHQAQDR